ncbi:MAG: extracellular solute-binding protein [Verrucomicrobia bacterium]|nr:extracellular solute-binding protein [Verrucomicrobiota bacterium]
MKRSSVEAMKRSRLRAFNRHQARARFNASSASARIAPALALLLGSVVVLAALVLLLVWKPQPPPGSAKEPLTVYCAAGIKAPVEAVAREYEKAFGVPVRLQFGGSQTLLANAEVARLGDLFLPADDSYLELARAKKLVAETLPLARMTAVLAVKKGNPKKLRSVDDLLRADVKLAQANPDAAAIGKLVREALQQTGQWDALQKRTAVFKPTVNDVANDIKLGTVDAGFIWDAVAAQYPELEPVRVPALEKAEAHISVAVLRSCPQPAAALRFARYLGARDKGLPEFARQHFTPADGDVWAETPEMVLYSGAMNRVAVEETLKRFQEREGVRITTVFNGCGILVGQMKAGGRPDAYLTCDQSFVPPVADLFAAAPVEMSASDIVILVPKGNPKAIAALSDLAKPGLKIGLANPEQSTLGALTKRLLEQGGLLDAVMKNVVAQTPTADMLVNQIRTGSLDATVVYVSNTMKVRDHLDIVALSGPGTTAVQTFSVGKNSQHKQLAGRLLEALRSEESRGRYQAAGFQWRGQGGSAKP